MVIAPFGSLDKDGWRLKLFGANSAYSYNRDHAYCLTAIDEKRRGVETRAPGLNLTTICSSLSSGTSSQNDRAQLSRTLEPFSLFINGDDIYYHQTYEVTRYEAAITPGYQFAAGGMIVKAWLGPGYEYARTTPGDPAKLIGGALWGAKGGLDAWLPLGDSAWVAADGSYFTASERYSASMRFGYKPMSWLTLGPQVAAFGDRDDTSARAGGFLSFTGLDMETTLSGGWTDNYSSDPSPYGAANIYVKF